MTETSEKPSSAAALAERLQTRFAESLSACVVAVGEVTIELPRDKLLEVCTALRDEPDLAFRQLIDVAGVDYSEYGQGQWATTASSNTGFSRGVDDDAPAAGTWDKGRFAAVYHLLSHRHNERLRIRVFLDSDMPVVDSVVGIWASANWFEREAFDLLGILFDGHPDLRRILTDYGFSGHPFRKDFPLIGQVEMRYDPEKQRVVYEPVSIEPRVLVPRVIRRERVAAASSSEGEPAGAGESEA